MNNNETNWKAPFKTVLDDGAKATEMQALIPALMKSIDEDQYKELISNQEVIDFFLKEQAELPEDEIDFQTASTNWKEEFCK